MLSQSYPQSLFSCMKLNIWDFCLTRQRLIVTCLSIVSHAAVFVSSPNAPPQAFEPWGGALRDKAKTASWRGRLAYQGQGYISVFPKDAITFSYFRTLKSLSLLTFLTTPKPSSSVSLSSYGVEICVLGSSDIKRVLKQMKKNLLTCISVTK